MATSEASHEHFRQACNRLIVLHHGQKLFDGQVEEGIEFYHKLNNENSLITNFTRSIAQDKKGNLWFGTKKGISIYNKNKGDWKHLKEFSKDNKIQAIVLTLESDNEFMWVGTYNLGLFKVNINDYSIVHYNSLYPKEDLISRIYNIKRDSKKNIWVAGIEKDLAVISPTNQIKKFPILQIKTITEKDKEN